MKIENWTMVTLEKRDLALARVNGGVTVELPKDTTKVVIRTVGDEEPAQA